MLPARCSGASAGLRDQTGRIRNGLHSVTRGVLTIGCQARSPKLGTRWCGDIDADGDDDPRGHPGGRHGGGGWASRDAPRPALPGEPLGFTRRPAEYDHVLASVDHSSTTLLTSNPLPLQRSRTYAGDIAVFPYEPSTPAYFAPANRSRSWVLCHARSSYALKRTPSRSSAAIASSGFFSPDLGRHPAPHRRGPLNRQQRIAARLHDS